MSSTNKKTDPKVGFFKALLITWKQQEQQRLLGKQQEQQQQVLLGKQQEQQRQVLLQEQQEQLQVPVLQQQVLVQEQLLLLFCRKQPKR